MATMWVHIPMNDLSRVHAELQSKLLGGAASAAYHMARSLSVEQLTRNPTRVVGSFSNLGDWSAVAPEEHLPWVFCPPVLTDVPLGAGCVTIGNRLSLMLQAHESIKNDCIGFSCEAWKQIVLNTV
jgi:hypothetical protein